MTDEQISPDGLVAASEEVNRTGRENEDRNRFGMRMRDSHDLWHCVTGYSRDLVGEASLLAFTFAQTRNPGIGAIVAMARDARSILAVMEIEDTSDKLSAKEVQTATDYLRGRLTATGQYIVRVVEFGRGPHVAASYFEWSFVEKRSDLSDGGLH